MTALVVMAAAVAPADAALFGDDEARKRIAEQQKQINALYQIHQELTERLVRAEEALKNQPVMALASQIEALREDMRQLRGQIEVPASASREEVEAAARANENVLRFTEGLGIRKVIVVPGKIVNIVAAAA